MKFKPITSIVVSLACVLIMTASCSTYEVHRRPVGKRGNGPPPHAPAYGHRNKHVDGVELVYDSGRGVYIVVGLSDHYYHDGYFYRLRGGLWEMSLKPDGNWKAASQKSLPMGLQVKAKANDNGNGKGKGKGKHKKDVVTIGRLF